MIFKSPLKYVGNPKGMGITSYQKVGSTSLIKFFRPHIFEDDEWTKIMIVMRNEQDRWISGFIEDLKLKDKKNLSPFYHDKTFPKGTFYSEWDSDNWNVLEWEYDQIDKFFEILAKEGSPYHTPKLFGFNGGHNHIGNDDWQIYIPDLITNPNVWFCNIEDLNERSMWEFCKHLDDSFTEWNFDNWQLHMVSKEQTKSWGENQNVSFNPKEKYVKTILKRYLNRKNVKDSFSFIGQILEKNQSIIRRIQDSERYYNNIGEI